MWVSISPSNQSLIAPDDDHFNFSIAFRLKATYSLCGAAHAHIKLSIYQQTIEKLIRWNCSFHSFAFLFCINSNSIRLYSVQTLSAHTHTWRLQQKSYFHLFIECVKSSVCRCADWKWNGFDTRLNAIRLLHFKYGVHTWRRYTLPVSIGMSSPSVENGMMHRIRMTFNYFHYRIDLISNLIKIRETKDSMNYGWEQEENDSKHSIWFR